VDINQRKKSISLVILGSLIACAISLWLLAWVYEGSATGYTPYACAGVSPDIRLTQCDTDLVLDNVAYVIWGVSWLALAIAGIVYYKLSKVT
jgi:hypothetical protein